MSASLVGSEMCIRDRLRAAAAWRAAARPRIVTGARGCRPGGLGRAGPASVSYTHLTLPTICSV
eukprot:830742-Alexandrium_andersonii.AAC.1